MSTISGGFITNAKPKRMELQAVVTRCGCGAPQSHAGGVCPSPRQVEDHGVVSYYHRSRFMVMWWRLKRIFHRVVITKGTPS